MVKDLRKLDPTLLFIKPRNPGNVVLCTFSDAAHPKDRDYGQTGLFIGILSRKGGLDSRDIMHLIDSSSYKQQRVSHFAYGAEILAAATSDARGYYEKMAVNTLFPETPIKHDMNVDSKALWDTITTLHEGKEYRLRQTVQRLRNSFESKETNVIRWIPRRDNLADVLTNRNLQMWERLNKICATGFLENCHRQGKMVDKDCW